MNNKQSPKVVAEDEDPCKARVWTLQQNWIYSSRINTEYVLITTPSKYDTENNCFNKSTAEAGIKTAASINTAAILIPTVSVGYLTRMIEELRCANIYCPLSLYENSNFLMTTAFFKVSSLRMIKSYWGICWIKGLSKKVLI